MNTNIPYRIRLTRRHAMKRKTPTRPWWAPIAYGCMVVLGTVVSLIGIAADNVSHLCYDAAESLAEQIRQVKGLEV